jgi:hypothetical protein
VKGLPARLKQPARRWIRPVVVANALGLLGCSSATDPGPVTVLPGATLPLDTTVRIDAGGTYLLAVGAGLLTARCTGRVTVTFTPPSGATQNNTCQSLDGSSNQTNDVTGVTRVMYDLDPGAFADVTVR